MTALLVTRQADAYLAAVAVTVPTVAVGQTSALLSVDVGVHVGTLMKIDVAIDPAQDAQLALRLFAKDGEDVGSLYTVFDATAIANDWHPRVNQPFANLDVPQTTNLYVQVQHTGGSEATGALPLILWIQA